MTGGRDLDDVLREWVDHGAERLPQHNLAAALAQVESTPQRGARWGPLEGFLMMLRPVAIPLAIAGVIILGVGAIALVSRPPSVGPQPTLLPTATLPPPASVTGELATTDFGVPLTLALPLAPDSDGWLVSETATMLRVAADESTTSSLIIVDAGRARNGAAQPLPEPLPDDLVAWLEGGSGIDAGVQMRFDLDEPESFPIAGQDAPVYTVENAAQESADLTVLQTTEGFTLTIQPGSLRWWVMPVETGQGDLLVILTPTADGETDFWGSYTDMAISMSIR